MFPMNCLFQRGSLGKRYKLPQRGPRRSPGSQNILKFYLGIGFGLGTRYSFICQGTSTRRQRSDLCGLRVKLPLVTTSLTTQRQRQSR